MPSALITGAGRGIGLATARAFLGAGWRVVSLDKLFGTEVVGERVDFDLRRRDEIPDLVAVLGEIDTLVNNAGVLYCEPYDAIPEDHRREILAVNLEAPAALIAAVAPQMKKRRAGRIVNVGSVAAFTGHPDLWYGISKAGLLNLTKAWARELGGTGCWSRGGASRPRCTTVAHRARRVPHTIPACCAGPKSQAICGWARSARYAAEPLDVNNDRIHMKH